MRNSSKAIPAGDGAAPDEGQGQWVDRRNFCSFATPRTGRRLVVCSRGTEGYDRGNRGGSNSVGTNEGYERSSVTKEVRRRPQTLTEILSHEQDCRAGDGVGRL